MEDQIRRRASAPEDEHALQPLLRDCCGNPGKHQCADQRRDHPAVPVHDGTVLRGLPQRTDFARHWMIGQQGQIYLGTDHVDDRVGDAEGEREDWCPVACGHEPSPRALLAIWPIRKLLHTRTASSKVTCLRALAYSWDNGTLQYAQ